MAFSLALAGTAVAVTDHVTPKIVPSAWGEAMEFTSDEPVPGAATEPVRWYPPFDDIDLCRYVDPMVLGDISNGNVVDYWVEAQHGDGGLIDGITGNRYTGTCALFIEGTADPRGTESPEDYTVIVDAEATYPVPNLEFYGPRWESWRAADYNECADDTLPDDAIEGMFECVYESEYDRADWYNDGYSLHTIVYPYDGVLTRVSYQLTIWAGNLFMSVRLVGEIVGDGQPSELRSRTHTLTKDILDNLAIGLPAR